MRSSRTRWWAVATAAALAGVPGARVATAQTVTLPSTRVGGPSPAVRQLLGLLERSRTLYDSASSDPDQAKRFRMLQVARARLILAPFTVGELKSLGTRVTDADVWLSSYRRQLGAADLATYAAIEHLAGELGTAAAPQPPARDTVGLAARARTRVFAFTGDTAALRVGADTVIVPSRSSPLGEDAAVTLLEPVLRRESDPARRALIDSLGRTARLVVIERKLRHRVVFPVHNRDQATVFWRQQGIAPLNIGAVGGNGSSGAAFTEFASPLLHFIRLSVNSIVAATERPGGTTASAPAATPPATEPGDAAAVTRFANGGGLLNVAFAVPALHWGLEDGKLDAMVLAVPRFGATPAALGAVGRDSTLFADGGVELHLKSVDIADGVGIVLQGRAGLAAGSRRFGDVLGVDGGRDRFRYANVVGGLMLGGRYLVTAGRFVAGPRPLRDLGWQVGITAVRAGAL